MKSRRSRRERHSRSGGFSLDGIFGMFSIFKSAKRKDRPYKVADDTEFVEKAQDDVIFPEEIQETHFEKNKEAEKQEQPEEADTNADYVTEAEKEEAKQPEQAKEVIDVEADNEAKIPAAAINPVTKCPEKVPLTETNPELYSLMGDKKFTSRKMKFKIFRTCLQVCIVAGLAYAIYMALFADKVYQAAEERDGIAEGADDTGFIALSYFGVDRVGNTSDLIGIEKLQEHLGALKRQGYVTITQQDIEDYYAKGKPLPKKALFLMFEDGRRDTAIFAQSALEHYNYKATVLTYPEKFDNKDPKFLLPDELLELEKSTFWELGSNGYRLQYINVFDRYNNYIGEIDPLRYAEIRSCLGRRYNHYLMDYIRDKNYVPKESYEHMKQRISYDYERMRDLYTEGVGRVPELYSIMHANTGKFGNNNNVSQVNEKWIRELFALNFNREGYCFNQRNSSVYDLTRMQPQPYWPVNHLLMRIKYDVNQEITFEKGTSYKYDTFELLNGAAEMRDESYILTTVPHSFALAKLKDSQNFVDMRLKVQLQGNAFGTQKIFLRANNDRSQYISVAIANGCLIVEEQKNGNHREIYKEKLSAIDGEPVVSVAEDRQQVEVEEYKAFARYADSTEMAKEYLARADKRSKDVEPTVADGAEVYENPASFHSRQYRDLDITLDKNKISLSIDGKQVLGNTEISVNQAGFVFLASGWNSEAWSQRNLADDVYDGVFKGLEIYNIFQDKESLVYTMAPDGWDLVKLRLKELGLNVIDFAVNHF